MSDTRKYTGSDEADWILIVKWLSVGLGDALNFQPDDRMFDFRVLVFTTIGQPFKTVFDNFCALIALLPQLEEYLNRIESPAAAAALELYLMMIF